MVLCYYYKSHIILDCTKYVIIHNKVKNIGYLQKDCHIGPGTGHS